MTTLITNAKVILDHHVEDNFCIAFDQGKIIGVGYEDNFMGMQDVMRIDAGGNYLAPGLIDLHCHGSFGFRFDYGLSAFREIMKGLPQYGVTGVLPTLVRPEGADTQRIIHQLAMSDIYGAQCLGFHFEGPFLQLTGAISPDSLGVADIGKVKMLIESSKPYPAVFSVSPDYEGIDQLIPTMYESSGTVFMTHTRASVEQTQKAIEYGVRHATHFYDVFPIPDEIEPGVRPCGAVEAVLADPRVSVDFILDGVHVHPVAIQMALKCKGSQNVCLITDASSGAGMKPGRFSRFNEEIIIEYEGGPARYGPKSRLPGTLAGSGLTMITAVKNAVTMLDISLRQAIEMASTNPARVLKIDDHKGKIHKGFDADLIIIDESFQVHKTFVNGELVFSKE